MTTLLSSVYSCLDPRALTLPLRLRRGLIHNERVAYPPEVSPLAENQPSSFADSIREARQRLALELRAQAEQIQKLNLELTELRSFTNEPSRKLPVNGMRLRARPRLPRRGLRAAGFAGYGAGKRFGRSPRPDDLHDSRTGV